MMSYSADFFAIWQRAASYVDRILKGARPADLPIEQATALALKINLKTAKALGLNLPADAHIAGGRGDRITFRRRLWHTASAGRPPARSGYGGEAGEPRRRSATSLVVAVLTLQRGQG